jgi:hypothetical protein
VGEAPKRGSKGEAPERGSKGEAPERGSNGEAPERGRETKPPSVGRKTKPPSMGEAPKRRSEGEAPEHGHTQMLIHEVRNLNFIAWCRRHNVGRGLLPTPDYIVEGVEETALLAKDRSGATARRSMGSLRLSPFSGCVGGMPLPG